MPNHAEPPLRCPEPDHFPPLPWTAQQQQDVPRRVLSPPPPPGSGGHFDGIERRRTIRIRRSALLEAKLDQIDRPSIKIAETLDEYRQAFTLLHDVYLASGYLPEANPSGLLLNPHHLLPRSCVFLFKSYLDVYSTMSYVPDTPQFGLPMDDLYKAEVDALRAKGRKVAEIGSLATIRHHCGQNLMVFLSKAIFRYALLTGADDLCIMVNPKHVRFYNAIFLFQPFGEQRHYAKVNALAVALRVDMRTIEPALRDAYAANDFDTDLHNFFVKINSHAIDNETTMGQAEKNAPLESEIARYLLTRNPVLLDDLSPQQRDYLTRMYHKALFGGPRLPR